MERIVGKTRRELDGFELRRTAASYQRVLLDLGTGDGRLVRQAAECDKNLFAIGIDTCRENLIRHSRVASPNALFLIADARDLPVDLYGLATLITVNFPWGSLLRSLLDGDSRLFTRIVRCLRPDGLLRISINAEAVGETGCSLGKGTELVVANLQRSGFDLQRRSLLTPVDLKNIPTTWAKRLAFGRNPAAVQIAARQPAVSSSRDNPEREQSRSRSTSKAIDFAETSTSLDPP